MKNILKKQLEQLEQTVKTPLTKPIINIRKPFDNKNGTVKKKTKNNRKRLRETLNNHQKINSNQCKPLQNQTNLLQTSRKPITKTIKTNKKPFTGPSNNH